MGGRNRVVGFALWPAKVSFTPRIVREHSESNLFGDSHFRHMAF
jgi:hypothetical protein